MPGNDFLGDTLLGQRNTDHDLRRDLGQRSSGRFRNEGRGAAGSRIDFQHVDREVVAAFLDGILDVHQATNLQGVRQLPGRIADFIEN